MQAFLFKIRFKKFSKKCTLKFMILNVKEILKKGDIDEQTG
ncbi:hypothetical protein LEP1GSC111_0028 [Leptospira interrogans str. UT126]|nr:hypothetical protein LEP1GSC019_0767 [Leptospira interrogans serovar Pyrogenes str. 2006006960]EMJ50931.1 hypothetical protein LEP1GSC111_0028 [Leptospira interrogans str. UT126]EMN66661.1 hypothetical protein LEP1GSC098_0340 [Leptospira interrogans serovar Grippotyphosa str. UI 08434]